MCVVDTHVYVCFLVQLMPPHHIGSFPLLLPATTSVLSLTITAADVHGSVATVTLTPG